MKYKKIKFMILMALLMLVFFLLNIQDHLITLLVSSILIDVLLGTYIAAILKKSPNNDSGELTSSYGYIGLVKKFSILAMVWIGYEIDLAFNIGTCKNLIAVGYLINEIISINENITIIGVKKNAAIAKVIDIIDSLYKKIG